MKPDYSSRVVRAHGAITAPVVLMNEAPGPDEDQAGKPCYGAQGGVIYRSLRQAGIDWALNTPEFSWPVLHQHKESSVSYLNRLKLKDEFLEARRRNLFVTNAYDQWPRPLIGKKKFCQPAIEDVTSSRNLKRISDEFNVNQRVLLIGGRLAYLACTGDELQKPAMYECQPLDSVELRAINERLGSKFEAAWYMGHTRRWSTHQSRTTRVLKEVAEIAKWMVC